MMKNEGLKNFLPYIGIPIFILVLLFIKHEQMDAISLLLRAVLLAIGYVAALGDLREKRVPNGLVGIMFGAWILIMVPQLFLHTEQALSLMLSGMAGFLMGGLVFLVVYLVSRKGLGGGDVKFMAASGLYLGFSSVMSTMLWGSVLAALTCGVLILTKKIGRKDTIPLVPFLYIGILITMFMQ